MANSTKDVSFIEAELDDQHDNESPETAPLLGGPMDDHNEDIKVLPQGGGRGQFLRSCFVLSSGIFLLVVAFTILQLGVLHQYVYYVYYKKYLPNVTYISGDKQKSYCNNSANGTSIEEQMQNKIQVLASQYMIYASLALYIPPIFGNFFLVTLSDTFGRKPFIIIPIFGALLRSALFVIGIHFELDLQWFILFLLLEGVTGGLYCQITVSFSYIADITEKGDKLIFLLVIIEVIAGVGGLLGTLSSGYLIRAFGFILPSFISSLCLFSALLLLGFFLPESLPHEFKSRSKRINFLSKFKGVWEFYISSKNGSGTRWRYVFSLLILTCVQLGIQGRVTVETLYELNKPFCWDSVLLGWFMAVRILSSYIIGLVLIRVLRCCVSVEFIALIGATSHMAAFILEAFAERTFELFLVPVVGFGSAMVGPVMRGIMSRMTAPDKQGTLFAGIGMMDSLFTILGTTVSNAVYSATVADFRGFVFLMFAGISSIAVVLIIVLWVAGMVGGTSAMRYQEEQEIIIEPKEEEDLINNLDKCLNQVQNMKEK